MEFVLLDTDIVSFILKGDERVLPYKSYLEGRIPVISFMTVAELFQWAEIRKWGEKRVGQLEVALNNYLIYPFTIELCKIWGKIRAGCREVGYTISPQDAWIAATALQFDLALATNNIADFEKIAGLKLIRPGE